MALYLYNCPEYMEASFAAFKAGLVPVNTNYRYLDDELAYLWDNADAVAVVFHSSFTERVAAVKERVPGVRQWLWVDDDRRRMPRLGHAVRGPPPRRAPPGRRALGVDRATTS